MKKLVMLFALAMLLATLGGCTAVEDALGKLGDDIEANVLDTPQNSGGNIDWSFVPVVREMATTLFMQSFPEAEVTEAAVASRNGQSDHVIVTLDFTLNGKSGKYGFEYRKNDAGEYELTRYGEGINSDSF